MLEGAILVAALSAGDPKAGDAATRNMPRGSACSFETASRASSIAASAARLDSYRAEPASVRCRRRVVRWMRREPSAASSRFTHLLTMLLERSRRVEAAVKLGDVYIRQSQPELALDLFRRAAEQFKQANRVEE